LKELGKVFKRSDLKKVIIEDMLTSNYIDRKRK
jgi:hypothetical protein